jgi:hypothetical protein
MHFLFRGCALVPTQTSEDLDMEDGQPDADGERCFAIGLAHVLQPATSPTDEYAPTYGPYGRAR